MTKIIDSVAVKRARFKRDSKRAVNAIIRTMDALALMLAQSNSEESFSAALDTLVDQIQRMAEEVRSELKIALPPAKSGRL
ncbi:hypothetical protein [Rhizobium sp. BK661]|uniref:hypothetical protein n=1 Tax=Rhizobium sp. BK661 TaxID=2586991 RepID=UPI00216A57BA|nr:hypothetical protein [Rhizobium sp. BK661]MCS3744310.1 hypothetical protein [Rhizobium sp. BK661]